jgi:hypothetical protein
MPKVTMKMSSSIYKSSCRYLESPMKLWVVIVGVDPNLVWKRHESTVSYVMTLLTTKSIRVSFEELRTS